MPQQKMPAGLDRRQQAAWFLTNVPGEAGAKCSFLKERKGYTDTEVLQAMDDATRGEVVRSGTMAPYQQREAP